MADTKCKNERMYAELKRKYEQSEEPTLRGDPADSPLGESTDRRGGGDRRQSINVVETDFRSGFDRRQDEGVIVEHGESLSEAKGRARNKKKIRRTKIVNPYSPVSKSTVNILESLLNQAKEGQLIGVAFVGIKRGRRPINGFSGYASQDPYFAMGAMKGLYDLLFEQAREKHY